MTELKQGGGGRGRWVPDDREEAGKLINKAEAAAPCLGIAPTNEGYVGLTSGTLDDGKQGGPEELSSGQRRHCWYN